MPKQRRTETPAERPAEAFVERLRRQEPEAFAELVARHQARLTKLAARLTGWPADVLGRIAISKNCVTRGKRIEHLERW